MACRYPLVGSDVTSCLLSHCQEVTPAENKHILLRSFLLLWQQLFLVSTVHHTEWFLSEFGTNVT